MRSTEKFRSLGYAQASRTSCGCAARRLTKKNLENPFGVNAQDIYSGLRLRASSMAIFGLYRRTKTAMNYRFLSDLAAGASPSGLSSRHLLRGDAYRYWQRYRAIGPSGYVP